MPWTFCDPSAYYTLGPDLLTPDLYILVFEISQHVGYNSCQGAGIVVSGCRGVVVGGLWPDLPASVTAHGACFCFAGVVDVFVFL
jgi:hypothetical protein